MWIGTWKTYGRRGRQGRDVKDVKDVGDVEDGEDVEDANVQCPCPCPEVQGGQFFFSLPAMLSPHSLSSCPSLR